MKNLIIISLLIVLCHTIPDVYINAQASPDFADSKEFTSLTEALKTPRAVFRLNLSNQDLNILNDSIWESFENVEYLSLKDDHLLEVPAGIASLKNLKILDLSGNDFKFLPNTFSELKNLREIYLNDEANMDADQSLSLLASLPNLKILHLENDNLDMLPAALFDFKNLEALYLDNNRFSSLANEKWAKLEYLEYLSIRNDQVAEIPSEFGALKNLKVLDLSGNNFTVLPQSFSRLEKLREIYLNDEKSMDVDKSLEAIKNLPNLRILHLENDNLSALPPSIKSFRQLEKLYLNNNKFDKVPAELDQLNNLNLIDLHDNNLRLNVNDLQFRESYKAKIRF